MSTDTSQEVSAQIVNLVRDFVRREVEPVAGRYDNEDIYPHELVERMAEMGLFGITVPEEYGGLGLDHTTFARIFEELSKGWMSITKDYPVERYYRDAPVMIIGEGTNEIQQLIIARRLLERYKI